MADPFVQWSPERLQYVGLLLVMAGGCVAMTLPLSELGATNRQRLALAAAMWGSSYYSLDQYPELLTVITLASAAMAVLIPLLLSANVVRDIVSA